MTESPTGQRTEQITGHPAGRSPFLEMLKVRNITWEDGQSRFEVTVEQRHLRHMGMIHGGVLASLLDTAAGIAASTRTPAGHFAVSVQLNCNFLRMAREGEQLVVTGRTKHAGRTTALALAEIHNAEGKLLASGSATMMYLPDAQRPPDAPPPSGADFCDG